jgi:hypothetical protein
MYGGIIVVNNSIESHQKMIKRKSLFLLLVPFLLALCVNVNTAAQNYISRGVDIDRSNIPKNILIGSFPGGRSHIKPMLDIAAILIERGYNVRIFVYSMFNVS